MPDIDPLYNNRDWRDVGQTRACKCGVTFAVPTTVPMPEADKQVRAWMQTHAKRCVDMANEIRAQGGVHLSR